MLNQLSIQNYVLIDHLTIDLSNGLTIITGETGAGKTILFGALGMLLGKRSNFESVRDKSKKCIIEGSFTFTDKRLKSFFHENDLDYSNETIIRREILPTMRSRNFINDTPVSLQCLQQLSHQLIDIHSQHDTVNLQSANIQFAILDGYLKNTSILESYQTNYHAYKLLCIKRDLLKATSAELERDHDYYTFQHDEIEELHLKENESTLLTNELATLTHHSLITQTCREISDLLSSHDSSVISQIAQIDSKLRHIQRYVPDGESLLNRVKSVAIELDDLSECITMMATDSDVNSGDVDLLQHRLDEINRLLHKHQKNHSNELIELKDDFFKKVSSTQDISADLNKLNCACAAKHTELLSLSKELSHARKSVIPKIEIELNQLIRKLGMPNARIKIQQILRNDLSERGIDSITFLIKTTTESTYLPIDRVASGGELSRLMLAIKAMMTYRFGRPLLLFDEIDSGVSGKVADLVGQLIANMAKDRQILAITHLPQIASKGDHHLRVEKQEIKGSTISTVRFLSKEERVSEVAHMLSGKKLTKTALTNAKELLQTA